jgi:hypothetical protein
VRGKPAYYKNKARGMLTVWQRISIVPGVTANIVFAQNITNKGKEFV